MKETQGALSMLLRRYRLILGKCRWNNMMAGLVLGGDPGDTGRHLGR